MTTLELVRGADIDFEPTLERAGVAPTDERLEALTRFVADFGTHNPFYEHPETGRVIEEVEDIVVADERLFIVRMGQHAWGRELDPQDFDVIEADLSADEPQGVRRNVIEASKYYDMRNSIGAVGSSFGLNLVLGAVPERGFGVERVALWMPRPASREPFSPRGWLFDGRGVDAPRVRLATLLQER